MRGFSLVELSIVLVILGLLVGGILAGQSLIHASELRAISSEYSRYLTATQAFRDKYLALPGDFNNATSFWGAANANANLCRTTPDTSPLTCNGNGDSKVADNTISYEQSRFWQHLANAGLVEGVYSGYPIAVTESAKNMASSKMNGMYWYSGFMDDIGAGTTPFDINYGNYFSVGTLQADGGLISGMGGFIPEDVWNIDTKLDDGMPGTGKIIVRYWSQCSTAANNADLTGTYKLTVTKKWCSIYFRNLF